MPERIPDNIIPPREGAGFDAENGVEEFSFEKIADLLAEARALVDEVDIARGSPNVAVLPKTLESLAGKRRAMEGYLEKTEVVLKEEREPAFAKRLKAAKMDLTAAIREIDALGITSSKN